jgi:hypothetical protein
MRFASEGLWTGISALILELVDGAGSNSTFSRSFSDNVAPNLHSWGRPLAWATSGVYSQGVVGPNIPVDSLFPIPDARPPMNILLRLHASGLTSILRQRTLGGCLLVSLSLALLSCPTASAQDRQEEPLRLGGVLPGGVRSSATTSWGAYDFNVANLSDTDRQARVLVMFDDRPDVQYGRDVWVPAHSTLSTWMLVGPAPVPPPGRLYCDIKTQLHDRSEGKDRLLLPPGEERMRSRGILCREREPFTAIMLDDAVPEPFVFGQVPQPDSKAEEAIRLARGFRLAHNLSELVPQIAPGPLPPLAEAFDGIDHFVLASGRIAQDPLGMRALRHWLQGGGRVWVMLDLVEPEVLAPLLGDALDFQVVDRVGLTSFVLQTHPMGRGMKAPPPQKHDHPVDFVRVLLPAQERAKHTIDGWPASFTRQVGRGKIVFTTLGPRGWFRPRTSRDPASPYRHFSTFPVPIAPLEDLAVELQLTPNETSFSVESFKPLLTEEIGYSVINRKTVALVFGVSLLAALALGMGLRKSHRPELLGWLGPVAALGATGVFLALGESSRRAAPPTVAIAQVVDAVSGKEETAVHGLLAVYRPESGAIEVDAEKGGFFELDMRGSEGKERRLILTDLDAWHWENVALPAGVRFASFHTTLPTKEPIVALAHFGPEGVEGQLTGAFEDLGDALLSSPRGGNLAVRMQPDGSFRARSQDILPKGQFLAQAVLNDRQQRRQELYRAFLQRSRTDPLHGRNVLLAWAKPIDMHFHLASDARKVGSALLVVPVRLERPAPGKRVTIPGPFLRYQRILEGVPSRPTLESGESADMHLRFQLPPEVMPFKIERARLSVRIAAPSRRVTIAGRNGDNLIKLLDAESPLDSLRVEITEEQLLQLDDEGGFHVNVKVSDSPRARAGKWAEKWSIEYVELEVFGRTSEG